MFRTVVVALLLLVARSTYATNSWQRIDDRLVSAADFYDQATGLVAFVGSSSILTKIDTNGETGVMSAPQAIASIVIQDSNSAWAIVGGTKLMHGTKGWTDWQLVHTSSQQLVLIFATATTIFLTEGGALEYTTDGVRYTTTSGIPTNALLAMDSLNDSTLFAVTAFGVYRAQHGPNTWTLMKDKLQHVRSVYADRVNNIVYVGGDTVIASSNDGRTWQKLQPPTFLHQLAMDGQVYGTHDCTGTFYLSNGLAAGGDILRSNDLGMTFLAVGRFPPSQDSIRKGFVFDRGSTFYWWDANGVLSVSRIGIDSLILQGIIPEFFATSQPVNISLCPSPKADVKLAVNSGTCIPLQVDSISVLNATGHYDSKVKSFVVTEDTTFIALAYTSLRSGVENTTLRLWYHGIKYPVRQSRDVVVRITSTSSPAVLDLPASLSFGKVTVDSTRNQTFLVSNTGCDSLRVDSIVSTNTDLFTVETHAYPVTLANGKSLSLAIHYHPNTPDSAIEALEIGTSVGHRFIEITGTGVRELQSVDQEMQQPEILHLAPNPASSIVSISSSKPGLCEIYDALGRVRRKLMIEFPKQEISVADLPPGEYFFHTAATTRKFVIQR